MKKTIWTRLAVLALAFVLASVAAAQEKPKTAAVDLKILPPQS